jgi:hypothetical protein
MIRTRKKKTRKSGPLAHTCEKKTNIITNLFKNTSISISFQTKSTIGQTAATKDNNTKQIHPKQHLPIKMP